MVNLSICTVGLLGVTGVLLSCTEEMCPERWVRDRQRGDGECEETCMTERCGFDVDCGEVCTASGCDPSQLGDSHCDSGNCYPACNLALCGWDHGDCGYCSQDCHLSMLNNSICESQCFHPLCDFDHWDCVDAQHPLNVFVSPTAQTPFLGTSTAPFQSISQALASLSVAYLAIYLLSGVHFLTKTTDNDLLSLSNSLHIHLDTALCAVWSVPGCSSTPVTVQLTSEPVFFLINTHFSISNINFQGGFYLKPGCTSETCRYCPEIDFDLATLNYINDRKEPININNYAEQRYCDVYRDFVLFDVQENSEFSLENVTFRDIRHQPAAVIRSFCGKISLKNVVFRNITVRRNGLRGGVVQWVHLDSHLPYYCGSFLYEVGTVELLNNGFEFLSHSNFTGFGYFSSIQFLLFLNITFKYNNMYVGEKSTASSSLVFIENFREIYVSNCEFLNNIADIGGGMYVSSAVKVPVVEENGRSKEHQLVSVWVENTRFEGNSARIGAALLVSFSEEHQNVKMENCTFVGNVAWERDIFSVFCSVLTPDMSVPTLKSQNGVDVLVPPSYVHFSSLHFTKNLAPYITYTHSPSPFLFSHSTFTSNGDSPSPFNPVLNAFIDYADSYVQKGSSRDFTVKCVNLMYVYNAEIVELEGIRFENGHCASGSAGVLFDQGLNTSQISRLAFTNNTGFGLLSLQLNGKNVSIHSLNFTNNTYISGNSPVCLLLHSALDLKSTSGNEILTPMSVHTTNMLFEGNIGLFSTIAKCSFMRFFDIKDSIFANNVALSDSAGIIFYPIMSENSYFRVENCEFRDNSAVSQGVVTILAERGDEMGLFALDWRVINCVFRGNYAKELGAAISTSGDLFFSSTSGVTGTVFDSNHCLDKGSSLHFQFTTGIVTVSNSIFRGNQGSIGAVIYSEHHTSLSTSTYLQLEDCEFTANSGESLVMVSDSLHPKLITSHVSFIGNTGTCIVIDKGIWEDHHSFASQNHAKIGTFVILSNTAIGSSSYSTVTANSAVVKGGAVAVDTYSRLTLLNASLTFNHCLNMAGAVFIDQLSQITLVNVNLEGNSCTGKAAAIMSLESNVTVINCSFRGNKAGSLGLINIWNSNFTLNESEVAGNTAGVRSPGIISMNSYLLISHTRFFNHSALEMGSFLYIRDQSSGLVTNSDFIQGVGMQAGAIFVDLNSNLTVQHSLFSLCSGEKYSGVLFCRFCAVNLVNITMENNIAPLGAALLSAYQGNISIKNSVFRNYTGSAVNAEAESEVKIEFVNFTQGIATFGAGIKAKDSSIAVWNCEFRDNTAKFGGCVYLKLKINSGNRYFFNASGNEFENCKGVNGGAVYADGVTLNLQNNVFYDNSALTANYQSSELETRGRGGAIYAVSSLHLHSFNAFIGNQFRGNQAEEEGGALYWRDSYPYLEGNEYANNTAVYGEDVGSYGIRLAAVYENNSVSEYVDWVNGEPTVYQIKAVGSGQLYDGVIRVAVVDHYGKIVTTDDRSAAEMSSEDQSKVAVTGKIHTTANKGVFEFTNISFLGIPGTVEVVHVTTNAINPLVQSTAKDPHSYHSRVLIQLSFRNCTIGEAQQGIKCYVCPGGTYSLDPQQPCKTCPINAICLGNWTMVPTPGYWRPDPTFETFFPCPNQDSCLGSPDMQHPSLTGECSHGYTGNLCSVCESGYSRQGRDLCNKCPNLTSNIVLSSLIGVGGVLLLIIAVAISIRGATRPRSEFAIYVKIFTNYVQMVVVAAALNVNWPGFVALFLNGQQTVGSVTDQLFSFECLGQEMFDMQGIFYKKIIGYVLLPVLLLCLAIFLWVLIKITTKMRAIPHKVVTSMVIIIFILHPSLTKVTFSIFSCTELLPNQYWLITDMSIRCWDLPHLHNILSIALPSIIVWVGVWTAAGDFRSVVSLPTTTECGVDSNKVQFFVQRI